MLIAIRHGDTEHNKEDQEKFRTPDVPLTSQGMMNAMKTAQFLKKVSLVDTSKPIFTSDVPRAVQTAHEIASTVGAGIQPTQNLRDWNLGSIMGTLVKDNLPQVHSLLDNPDQPAPGGGESYNDYFNRTYPALKELVESPDINTAVTHNRTMTLLHALTKTGGQPPDVSYLKEKGPVEPAGFMIVGSDWNQIHTDKIPGEKHIESAETS